MNLVSVLIAPAVVQADASASDANAALRIVIALVAFAIIVAAVVVSKRRESSMGDAPASRRRAPPGRLTRAAGDDRVDDPSSD